MIDRIDLHVHVPAVKVEKLTDTKETRTSRESSQNVQKRVQMARNMQVKRFAKTQYTANGEMGTKAVKEFCILPADAHALLTTAVSRLHISARSYYRIIKVARTIADLEGATDITSSHIAEALQYRPKEE